MKTTAMSKDCVTITFTLREIEFILKRLVGRADTEKQARLAVSAKRKIRMGITEWKRGRELL